MKPYIRLVKGQSFDYESPALRSELNYMKIDRKYAGQRFHLRPDKYKTHRKGK